MKRCLYCRFLHLCSKTTPNNGQIWKLWVFGQELSHLECQHWTNLPALMVGLLWRLQTLPCQLAVIKCSSKCSSTIVCNEYGLQAFQNNHHFVYWTSYRATRMSIWITECNTTLLMKSCLCCWFLHQCSKTTPNDGQIWKLVVFSQELSHSECQHWTNLAALKVELL